MIGGETDRDFILRSLSPKRFPQKTLKDSSPQRDKQTKNIKMGIKNGRARLIQLKVKNKIKSISEIKEMNLPIHLDLQGSFYTLLRDFPHQLKNILLSLNEKNQLKVWLEGGYSDQKHDTHSNRTEAKKLAVQK